MIKADDVRDGRGIIEIYIQHKRMQKQDIIH